LLPRHRAVDCSLGYSLGQMTDGSMKQAGEVNIIDIRLMLSFCPYGYVSRGTSSGTYWNDESVRVVPLEDRQLSFNAIHTSNQHCSDEILTGKHRMAHDGQTRLTITCYRVRENNIAESSVLFWETVCEEPTLIEHY